jgi:Flp pilus assembly protein TadD
VSSAASNLESVHPELRDATFRLRLQPTAAHHLLVARVYRRLGIFDTAHDYLERSLAVNGPTPEVHDALARLWRDWGEPGIALSHAHRAVYLAPAWTVARNTLATVLYALGRRLDARKQLEEAVARDPRATYVLDNLCVLYQAEGRTREAISVCRQADAARRRTGAGPGEEVR